MLPVVGSCILCGWVCELLQDISAELSRVFGSNGFHVSLVLHKDISSSTWSKIRPLTKMNEQEVGVELLFVAKQLRLSDHRQASVDNFGILLEYTWRCVRLER